MIIINLELDREYREIKEFRDVEREEVKRSILPTTAFRRRRRK